MRAIPGLTDAEVKHFHEEGYVVIRELFGDSDLQGVIDEITQVITARAEQMVAEGRLSRSYQEGGFERQLALISRESDEVAKSIWGHAGVLSAAFGLIIHPRLLDIAEVLLGPEVIAGSGFRLRPKIPNYPYGNVPWHQDSGYMEPYCDRALVVTVWVPLVDATLERGCLHVIPRVHRQGIARHQHEAHKWYLEIPPDALPAGAPLPLPMRKGDVLLLTNLTPHASFDNTTDVVRWSVDLRYQGAKLPTNAAFDRTEEERAAQTGPDVPGACYPPEADFLVRSRLRPEQVIRKAEDFERIRKRHEVRYVSDRWGVWA